MFFKSSILLSAVVATLLFSGCGDKEEQKQTVSAPVVEEVKKTVQETQVKQEPISVKKEEAVIQPETIEKVKETVQEVVNDVVVSEASGAQLYAKCAGCHGITADKKALGKSAVIKEWDSTKVYNALKGYKDGSYGGAMKGLMKSQVAGLSDGDMKVLGDYISKQ